ncbi:MAG: AtpZ/AtpI family protein [Patescibacteria group bacterium]|jgi:F0F1-type ATP synthase assembly protein I
MKNDSWSIALRVLVNLSGWIAGPIIIGLIVGKWLDKKYGTEPWLFLTTIGVCFLVSMYGLVINALKEFKKIERESRGEDKQAEIVQKETLNEDKKDDNLK